MFFGILKNLLYVMVLCQSIAAFASDSLSYSGRLVNTNGSPVTGPVNLKFDFAYTNATTSILCSEQISAVALTNGVFHVKLDPDCTPSSWLNVLSAVPAGEALAVRVTDETHTKAYSFQALHSMPLATMSQMSKQLAQMGATAGMVLKWNGTAWEPAAETGTGNGSVTSVATGTGLTGGPITVSGTISIANGGVDTAQLADGGVTDQKIASGISRAKISAGAASHVIVNDGAGALTSVAQLPITQGGTGAANAAGARTNLGLGSAAVVDLGNGVGRAMPSDSVPVCMAFEKLQMTAGPAFLWTCVPDNDSLDNTKLPLDGSVAMTGHLDMDNHLILDVATPTAAGHAANKAYVDSVVGGVNSSQWTTNAANIHFSTGNVGVGVAAPTTKLQVVGATNTSIDGSGLINANGSGSAARNTGVNVTGTESNSDQLGMQFVLQNATNGTGYLAMGVRNIASGDKYSYITSSYGTGAVPLHLHAAASHVLVPTSNFGVGTTNPTEKIDVSGNIALTGKVRMKSDTANYVELKAPASLASTLTFNLPGSAGTSGQALITDGAGNLSWATVATGASAVGGDLSGTVSSATVINGAINSAKIADGSIVDADVSATAAIAQSKISGLTTDLAGKEPTIAAGTTAQYWRGDKSWQTLNTTAVVEGTNLYFTEPRVLGTDLAGFSSGAGAITAADTVLTAFGKLDGNISALSTAATANFVNVTGDTMSGPLAMGNQNITGLAAPTANDHAATKAYVDSQVTGSSHWTKTGTAVHYDGGRVGVGTSTPGGKLTIAGATPEVASISGDNTVQLFGSGSAYYMGRDVTNDIEFVFGTSVADEVFSGSMTNHDYSLRTGNNKRLTVKADGKVGIGTTAPTERLTVDGNINIRNPGATTNRSLNIAVNGGGEKTFVRFDQTASPGAGYYWDVGSLSGSNVYDLGFEYGGNRRMTILSAGNVGIGTATPSEKLDVAGNIQLTGSVRMKSDTANYVVMRAPASLAATQTLTWPGTAGSSGNALTTDGAGNLSWTAVATSATSVGGDLTGSISNAQIAAGAIVDADVSATAAIAQSKIANLTTDLAGKEPTITAGTTAQYRRGDKTWQTLNTTAVPEGTNLYFTAPRTMSAAIGAMPAGSVLPLSSIAPAGSVAQALANLDASIANMQGDGRWSKNGSTVYYNGGVVGVGYSTAKASTSNIQSSGDITLATSGSANTVHFNSYYDTTWRAYNAGYAGAVRFDSTNGQLQFWTSPASVAANVASSATTAMTISPNTDVATNSNFRVGAVAPAGTVDVAGYGSRLNFSGGPAQNGRDGDNSDALWMSRYNISNDVTELHLNVGDNGSGSDAFEIGYLNGTWVPNFRVQSNGFVGIGIDPTAKLNVNGKIRSEASATDTVLTRIPADSEIMLETAGNGSTSAWLWREKWATGNYGIFHDNTADKLHIVGNGISRFNVNLANGEVSIPGSITSGYTSKTAVTRSLTATGGDTVSIGSLSNNAKATWVRFRLNAHNGGNIDAATYEVNLTAYQNTATTTGWQEIPKGPGSSSWEGITTYTIDVYRANPLSSVSPFYFRVRNKDNGSGNGPMDIVIEYDDHATFTPLDVQNNIATAFNASTAPAGGPIDGYYGSTDFAFPVSQGHAWNASTGAGMFINNNGNVGIGILNPAYKLDVQGGNVNSAGAYTNTSDVRLKEDIKPLQNSLDKVVKLKPVSYYWKDKSFDGSKQVGFIAQEVEKVYPEVVKTDAKGWKTMSYPQLVSPIVDAIKELYARWSTDHERIAKLERENKLLREQNEDIMRRLDKLEQTRQPASVKAPNKK